MLPTKPSTNWAPHQSHLQLKAQCTATILRGLNIGHRLQPEFRAAVAYLPMPYDQKGQPTHQAMVQTTLIGQLKRQPTIDLATLPLFEDGCDDYLCLVLEAIREVFESGTDEEKVRVALVLAKSLQDVKLPIAIKDPAQQLMISYLEDVAAHNTSFKCVGDVCVQLLTNLTESDDAYVFVGALKNAILGASNIEVHEDQVFMVLGEIKKILSAVTEISKNPDIPGMTKKFLYQITKELIHSPLFAAAEKSRDDRLRPFYCNNDFDGLISTYLYSELSNGNNDAKFVYADRLGDKDIDVRREGIDCRALSYQLYEELANGHPPHPESMFRLGIVHFQDGKSYQPSDHYFKQQHARAATEDDLKKAGCSSGRASAFIEERTEDELAEKYFTAAAALGHKEAKKWLDKMHFEFRGKNAIASLEVMDWEGHGAATYQLAVAYSLGVLVGQKIVVERNPRESMRLVTRAADELHLCKALVDLGHTYSKDREEHGVDKDELKAIDYFSRAVKLDRNREAAYSLGMLYLAHNANEKAIESLMIAYDQECSDATYQLGVIHEQGISDIVPIDFGIARGYYEKAASAGHADANCRWGEILVEEELGNKRYYHDRPSSHERYFKGAATAGSAKGAFLLAELDYRGRLTATEGLRNGIHGRLSEDSPLAIKLKGKYLKRLQQAADANYLPALQRFEEIYRQGDDDLWILPNEEFANVYSEKIRQLTSATTTQIK